MLAFGQLHFELLDKGGHVAIGDYRAFVFLDAEYGLGNNDFEVFFHLDLAPEAPMVLNLFAGEETHLGGEYGTATFNDTAFALSARPFAATGRGQVNLLFGKCGDKGVACGDGEFFVVVDGDGHIALGHKFGTEHQKQCHQKEDDHQENDEGCYDSCAH